MFHVTRLSSPRLAHVAGTSASSARLANANPQSHRPQDHSLLLGHDATWSFATIWTTFGGDVQNASCQTQTDVLSSIYSAALLNLKCFVNWPLVLMYDIKIHSTTLSWDAPHLRTCHVLGGRKNAEPVDWWKLSSTGWYLFFCFKAHTVLLLNKLNLLSSHLLASIYHQFHLRQPPRSRLWQLATRFELFLYAGLYRMHASETETQTSLKYVQNNTHAKKG